MSNIRISLTKAELIRMTKERKISYAHKTKAVLGKLLNVTLSTSTLSAVAMSKEGKKRRRAVSRRIYK